MLIVEDGSVVANADSYQSIVEADAYWAKHASPVAWTGATDAIKESALRYATQWIDQKFTWGGDIYTSTQVLDWPRQSCYDDEGRLIADDIVPLAVQQATDEMAKNHIDAAVNESIARGGGVKSEKVDVITIVYLDWASPETDFPYIKRMLMGLTSTGQVGTVPVSRVA